MATTTRSRAVEPDLMASQMFAQVFQAYMECSEEVQGVVRDMVEIVNDPETSEDDRSMALATIGEALFPSYHDGQPGVDLEEAERLTACGGEEVREIHAAMDREEAHFSARVEALLRERKMTQSQLAEMCEMGQSAVSNLLSRRSRPQRRTVQKLARALGVCPSDLWPDYDARP